MPGQDITFDAYLKNQAFVKAFVKGPSGTGKTYLCGSISKIMSTLYVDVEGGIMSAGPVIDRANLKLRVIKEPDPVIFFDRVGDALDSAEAGGYEAVIIDSMTEIAGRMEDQYSSGEAGKVDIHDWFKLTTRVKKLARRLRDLKCHTIVTAVTKPTGRDESNAIFEPVLPGQTAAVVPSVFDIVALMKRGSGKDAGSYEFVTDGPSVYQVRDRTHTIAGVEKIDAKAPWKLWEKIITGIQTMASQGVMAQA